WALGYPDQGLARSHEAVTLAQQLAHPFSLSFALSFAAMFHQYRREVRAVQERAEAVIRLAQEQGFAQWLASGSLLHGWARMQQGHVKEGIAQINQCMMDYRATGAELGRPRYLALLAEAHGAIGQPATGLTALAEALTLWAT